MDDFSKSMFQRKLGGETEKKLSNKLWPSVLRERDVLSLVLAQGWATTKSPTNHLPVQYIIRLPHIMRALAYE